MWQASGFDNFGVRSDQPAGGFLSNTNSFNSPSKSQEEKKRADRVTNIVPCTVAQLLKVPENEDHLTIGSVSAHIITIVGLILKVDVHSTKISCIVDDLSGPPIEVQLWVGESEDIERNAADLQVNKYVHVTGALRMIRGKRHIIAFKISPLREANEITMHLLEIVHTSMMITIKDTQLSPSKNQDHAMFGTQSMTTNTFTPAPTGGVSFNQSLFAPVGLTRPQQMVLQSIAACKNEQGAYIGDIFGEMTSLNRTTIHDAVEFLSNEGHIYSTIDDNHFKSTDSG